MADKHKEGATKRLFPASDEVEDNDKVTATPIDKVYEHGFYPLGAVFRASPTDPPTTARAELPDLSQWPEILSHGSDRSGAGGRTTRSPAGRTS